MVMWPDGNETSSLIEEESKEEYILYY